MSSPLQQLLDEYYNALDQMLKINYTRGQQGVKFQNTLLIHSAGPLLPVSAIAFLVYDIAIMFSDEVSLSLSI